MSARAPRAKVRFAPRVRTLFGAVLLLVLVLPMVIVAALRLYENALVRQTEEVLVAEAVVVGEAYRWELDPDGARAPLAPLRDPESERYHPFAPQLDLERSPMLPPARRGDTSTVTAAGADLSALLQRVVIRNLSGIRVIDRSGRVIASTTPDVGYSLAHLPEVEAALHGRYAPVLRRRVSDSPSPPLSSLSRAAELRVSIAVPIYQDARTTAGSGAEVLGAVYSSRTPLEPAKALWLWRDKLYFPSLLAVAITLGIVAFLTFTISRPLSRLRNHAERVAAGDPQAQSPEHRIAPQEVRALAESIEHMRAQLVARAEYIREFATNTAHELKTPLTSLRGAAELLLDDWSEMTDEHRARFLTNIQNDALRMDALVGRILELARIESGPPPREQLDLRAFLEGTAERYRRHGHDVQFRYEAKASEVSFAPDQLDAMITNLLDNAVRHGEGQPVELVVKDAARGRTIEVRDHGPTLPAGHFDHAFRRFYTTERGRGGTGLGLAIVKAIAEAHGGSVEVRAEDRGATFTVHVA